MDGLISMIAVLEARRRIAPYVRRTPFVRSAWLSGLTGAEVWLKLECLQRTHAFKARGAFNAALRLAETDRGQTMVTASAGNHGRALAEAASTIGMPCVVFAPAAAPRTKLDAIAATGARLDASARNYDEAEAAAKAYAAASGACFISPYSHPDVIAGGGTVAVEMAEDLPRLDVVVAPVGGGGLISGMGVALAHLAPACRLVGVEAALNPALATARRHGRITEIPVCDTIADGLGGNLEPGAVTFDYVQRYVRDLADADDASIAAAIGDLVEHEHLIVEGAAAVGVAALRTGRIADVAGRTVGVVLTGANIDRARLAGCL